MVGWKNSRNSTIYAMMTREEGVDRPETIESWSERAREITKGME
jgi:hypothetical protein